MTRGGITMSRNASQPQNFKYDKWTFFTQVLATLGTLGSLLIAYLAWQYVKPIVIIREQNIPSQQTVVTPSPSVSPTPTPIAPQKQPGRTNRTAAGDDLYCGVVDEEGNPVLDENGEQELVRCSDGKPLGP